MKLSRRRRPVFRVHRMVGGPWSLQWQVAHDACPKPLRVSGAEWAEDANECWLWLGLLGKDGYGIALGAFGFVGAARYLYGFAKPDERIESLFLDHTCYERKCVNPNHLAPVTQREHFRRMRQRQRALRAM